MAGATALESALRRDRRWVVGSLSLAVLLCWTWIVPMARDMYGAMDGASAWMVRGGTPVYGLLLLAMWLVMMAGMMLPSAAPTLLLYAGVVRHAGNRGVAAQVYVFAGGYLLVWGGFSLAAALLQELLARALLLSPMLELRQRGLAAALLLLAGAWQLTPWKRDCLDSCQAPAVFIARRWRAGTRGALRMGLAHGAYCLGCCWALMLLLFVGGVMNLWCIAALTVFVLLEKLAPLGAQGGRLSGVLLLLAGAAWLAHAIA